MSKTGQKDNPAFVTVKHKKGSEAYKLYRTHTCDGPMYNSFCIDAENDEIEIDFIDGCASISTAKFKYLILRPEQLFTLVDLIKEAKQHFEAWSKSRMGQDFEAAETNGPWIRFRQKDKEVMNIRSEALDQ